MRTRIKSLWTGWRSCENCRRQCAWYSTGSLRTNRAYWAEINGFEKYDQLAHIDAQIKPDNVIEVSADNITRFTLRPPAKFLTAGKPISLIVNGVQEKETFDEAQPIQWPRATPNIELQKNGELQKNSQRVGPIKECYRDLFMVVYGTQQKPDGTSNLALMNDQASAQRFVREWELYADGKPPLKADKDVTESDKKTYNLIVFGTRETNSIIAAIADKLPLELTSKGYRVGAQEYSVNADNWGLQLCYPSPFDDKRMIVLQSGLYWGEALAINHKFDLLPEYIVYTDEIERTDQTNRAVTAGFFDDNWQLTPRADAPFSRVAPLVENPDWTRVPQADTSQLPSYFAP